MHKADTNTDFSTTNTDHEHERRHGDTTSGAEHGGRCRQTREKRENIELARSDQHPKTGVEPVSVQGKQKSEALTRISQRQAKNSTALTRLGLQSKPLGLLWDFRATPSGLPGNPFGCSEQPLWAFRVTPLGSEQPLWDFRASPLGLPSKPSGTSEQPLWDIKESPLGVPRNPLR